MQMELKRKLAITGLVVLAVLFISQTAAAGAFDPLTGAGGYFDPLTGAGGYFDPL